LGFLPGDFAQKVDPYCALSTTRSTLMASDKTQACSNAHDRNRAARLHARAHPQPFLHHSRRAQNTTPEQMKMFLTRIGFGTKAVITGDVTQIDS